MEGRRGKVIVVLGWWVNCGMTGVVKVGGVSGMVYVWYVLGRRRCDGVE